MSNLREAMFDAAAEDAHLDELGLLDPDQPTRYGYLLERRRLARLGDPFTDTERREIRWALGMGGEG